MTIVRRLSYLLVVLPLLVGACGRQPLLDQPETNGVGGNPSPDGDKPRGIDPDRDGDDGDRDGDDDGDRDDDDRDRPTEPMMGPIPRPVQPRPPAPPVQPPPPQMPPPITCQDKCAVEANAIYNACFARTGDKPSCERRSIDAYRSCAIENCGGKVEPPPGPPSPPQPITCEDQCVVESAGGFIECVQSGRQLEFCAVLAQGDVDRCQRSCSEADGVPMSCQDECSRRSTNNLTQCLQQGRPGQQCLRRQSSEFRECVQRCR